MIDLHIHSTASDGSLTPLEILELAKESHIEAISLTDHDSINGIGEILQHIQSFPLEFITGVEISCSPPSDFESLGSIHMLGYGFSIYDRELIKFLEHAKEVRIKRNISMIKALNKLGIDINIEQINQRFGQVEQLGRPHIAECLKEIGVVETFAQAFELYIGKGKPAYIDEFKVSCEHAIKVILNAGGIPVLAHPGLLDFPAEKNLEQFIQLLITYGIQGVEVFYTEHDDNTIKLLANIAQQNKLLMTGGSDFHGLFNSGVKLGVGRDNINVDYLLFKALMDRMIKIRSSNFKLNILESNLTYRFIDRELLNNALTHRSYLNENQKSCSSDNERLEFLGDAVLGLCVGHLLMEKSPSKKEGELSKLRSHLVSEPALADMARNIDLGRFIKLGKGEAVSGGAEKNSILADTFEAIVAAIYLDAGFEKTLELIRNLFSPDIDQALYTMDIVDYKSALQEYAQDAWTITPSYTVSKEIGPDHDKIFEIRLNLADIQVTGLGRTKKAAEQDSAKNALKLIKKD